MGKVIGIIGAMDEEIETLLGSIQMRDKKKYAGITYYLGKMHEQDVVLCKSGVGKVNASICAQLMITTFAVDCVLFTGVAGGVDPKLSIGDIVISTDCLQHDMDASALGFERGYIPFAPESIFNADQDLINLAEQAAKSTSYPFTIGRVITGDQFIADHGQVLQLHQLFQASCIEMEGAAVAQVCTLNQVPFVIIRSLSDKADGSADVNFVEFTKLAAERSHEIVNYMVRNM